MTTSPDTPQTFYDWVGGHDTFHRLVARFYEGVAHDPLLRPMYPESDLAGASRRLRMFLEQYWGGPRTYSQERGHPRLRMRHAGFPVTPAARDAWLGHMRVAVDEADMPAAAQAQLWEYLYGAAMTLVNTFEEPPAGPADNSADNSRKENSQKNVR